MTKKIVKNADLVRDCWIYDSALAATNHPEPKLRATFSHSQRLTQIQSASVFCARTNVENNRSPHLFPALNIRLDIEPNMDPYGPKKGHNYMI